MPSFKEQLQANLEAQWPAYFEQIIVQAIAAGHTEAEMRQSEAMLKTLFTSVIDQIAESYRQGCNDAAAVLEGVISAYTFNAAQPEAYCFKPRVNHILERAVASMRYLGSDEPDGSDTPQF